MSDNSNSTSVMAELSTLIRNWEDEHTDTNYDPISTLTRLAEICEEGFENYLKMDPDPFDERHPSRTDPECILGQILKTLFRKDNFMNKLVNDYLRDTYYSRAGITGKDVDQLNIAACRLMLDVMPGLETTAVFQPDMDTLIHRLIKWTTNSIEPLQSYATGLLAAAMEIPEIATRFREQNERLVPLLLQRLARLQQQSNFTDTNINNRPFAHLSSMKSSPYRGDGVIKTPASVKRRRENGVTPSKTPQRTNEMNSSNESLDSEATPKRKRLRNALANSITHQPTDKPLLHNEASNSSWAELETFMIGTVQIFPPTNITRQILILRYLTPMGEYQEFLSHVFENNALSLILSYVNVRITKQARLAFEALKYLAALLCHKKFSIEFIQIDGINALLEVPRPSIAATGVSICLYYLGYCEEAMERVCLLPKETINKLVTYALWLLECSHGSGRCHAIMFFGLTFQFKVILDEFDAQYGLRMLHNVIATLPILLPDVELVLDEDTECAARQIVRHVCVAYRRYLEAHLHAKVQPFLCAENKQTSTMQLAYKASKASPEEIQQHVETLMKHMPVNGTWTPVDQLFKLDGITLLLKIIAFAYEWNFGGRAETVRSALDVLAIACIMPRVQEQLCERIDLPEEIATFGINIILGAADGEIVADAEVQKAALRVICNCVCAPITRPTSTSSQKMAMLVNSPMKRRVKTNEAFIERVWDCVRSNSGIMVLIQLMNTKIPITDADCIRTLACKALAGLARSETVRQIVSKLPLLTSGQLQNLMRDPILQEKRLEHVSFQKYAIELLERLSGKTKLKGYDIEASLANFHRCSVVAQTKIQFNNRQVFQLIHQHLVANNCRETADMLVREANLGNSVIPISSSSSQPTKFRYSTSLTPCCMKLSFASPARSIMAREENRDQLNDSLLNTSTTSSTLTPIKIIKKTKDVFMTPPHANNSRLQKQTNNDMVVRIYNNQSSIDEAITPLSTPADQPCVTLDSIITQYLASQHALCKNPMARCPKFDLFVPHKCPDPKPRLPSSNVVVRCARRAIGYQCREMSRKFIHSRFCPVQTIRSSSPSDGDFFTCARFLPGHNSILVGDYSGDVRLFNCQTGNQEFMFQAHDNYIVHFEPNRTGEFLLTSSTWGRPLSALWSIRNNDMKFPLDDEEYVEYSKVTQDRILATKLEVATIYDAGTGVAISRLSPTTSNHYTKNKATFSPCDKLVLSDGVIFDVASGKQIHKLDKLNQTQSGVFHPNGLEIVSNTEVWDMRTFHLLKTVSALNQCSAIFSPLNNTIYAISMEQELDDGDSTYDSSFKTIDAIDYSSIATIDVKKNIYDLAVDRFDTQIAIVENQGMYESMQESVVRIYDVGRKRSDEDEQDEEDEDDDMDGSDDDGSDNEIDITERDIYLDNAANNAMNGNGNQDNSDSDEEFILSDVESDSWTSLSSGSDNDDEEDGGGDDGEDDDDEQFNL